MEWLRLYHSLTDNQKVQSLPGNDFKFWVNLLVLASKNTPRGTLPPVEKIAFALRQRIDHVELALSKQLTYGLVEKKLGLFYMHDWDVYQYESDDVNKRVSRFRNAKTNVHETLHETLPATLPATVPEYRLQNTENSTDSVQSLEPEDLQALDKPPLPPSRGAGLNSKPKKVEVLPEHWPSLVRVAEGAGMPYGAGEVPKLIRIWVKLPIDERLIAIEGISIRVDGEYADPAYVPRLRRYLVEKLWTAKQRPPPAKNAVTSIDLNKRALMEVFERQRFEQKGVS